MVFVSLILLLSLGWHYQRSTILKNRETNKKADVARGVTVITKQRSQTIEEMEKLLLIWINEIWFCVKNLCTKYCCKSLNKQLSGVQEWINPFTLIPMGKIVSVYERTKFVNWGLTVHIIKCLCVHTKQSSWNPNSTTLEPELPQHVHLGNCYHHHHHPHRHTGPTAWFQPSPPHCCFSTPFCSLSWFSSCYLHFF